MIWLGDMNAKIGSVTTGGIGDNAADLEDIAGTELREACTENNMTIPSTFVQWHDSNAWTYVNPSGFRSRNDYIAVAEDILPGVAKSFSIPTIDLMNGDADHIPIGLEIQMTELSDAKNCLRRIPLYDRDKAREAKANAFWDPMDAIPACPWTCDLNRHWSIMRDSLQDHMARWFPTPKRRKRQLYFSDKCWEMVCQRKELRQAHRAMQRELNIHMLHACFKAWKDTQEDHTYSRLHKHVMQMQFAMTLHERQKLDVRFRSQKKDDWKSWVTSIFESKVEQLKYAKGTDLYKIIQPKRMISKSAGHHRKALPGFRDENGTWISGRQNIALAWQAQFGRIEHAEPADMQAMIHASKPTCSPRTVADLQDLPSIYQVESAIRQMSDRKAPGLDNIGSEVFQFNVSKSAQKIYPLLVKSALRKQPLPELSGGWLVPLHKGRTSQQYMPGFRAILLEPTLGRILSKSWRPKLEKALAIQAMHMQYGGRKGLAIESLHLQTRMWCANAASAKLALSIIYVDIKAAFYSVSKQFLVGCKNPENEVRDLCHRLRIPDTAYTDFMQHITQAKLLYKATGSNTITDSIGATLQATWFAVANAHQIQSPTTGSRPGDPMADLLYGFVMSEFLTKVHDKLEAADVWKYTPGQAHAQPVNLTWVDDTAFAVYAPCDQITALTLETLSAIIDTAAEFGLALSYGQGKTAVVTSFHGRGAIRARQTFESNFPVELPVLTEHQGVVPVPLTNHYRHLGGVVLRGGVLLPEIKIRAAQTLTRIRPLRKVLADARVDLKHRQTMMKTMGLSVATLHSGTWFDLKASDYRAWQAMLFRLYSALSPVQAQDFQNMFELALQANSPMPMELLHVAKLRLMIHMIQVGDDLMFEAILSHHHCTGSASWLAGLMRSCEWWKEQLGEETLPEALCHLTQLQTWRDLQNQVWDMKRALRKAHRAHMSRLRTWSALHKHMVFQQQALQDLGWELEEAALQAQEDCFTCNECARSFSTNAALAVHQSRAHGQRLAVRRVTADSVCRPCGRQFHTRARLLSHLHYGSTKCWVAALRAFAPMSDDQTDALDHQDRINHQAHHQRGLKSHASDRQWRPATEMEITPLPDMQPLTTEWDFTDPSQEELSMWSRLGTLPTGQGGREKTSRQIQDIHVKHVGSATNDLEQAALDRAKRWRPNFDAVPGPMSGGERYVLILFSGHRRMGDIGSHLNWSGHLVPICIDLTIDQHFGDVMNIGPWLDLIRAKRIVAAHAGPPCETYTLARWLAPDNPKEHYPRPLRTAQDPWGCWFRTVAETEQCEVGTILMLQAIKLLLLVYLHGGAFTLEHPAGPQAQPALQRQWSIWSSGFIKELLNAPDIRVIQFLQGPLGQVSPKPTKLLTARLLALPQQIYSQYDQHWKADYFLGGKSNGVWRTAVAKIYPPRLCKILAQAYDDFARQCQYGEVQQLSANAQAAVAAMAGMWDPYDVFAKGTMMANDYHGRRAAN